MGNTAILASGDSRVSRNEGVLVLLYILSFLRITMRRELYQNFLVLYVTPAKKSSGAPMAQPLPPEFGSSPGHVTSMERQ